MTEAWYGIRWLEAVRNHAGRTRYAVLAANALAPYTDNDTGEAQVSLARLAADQRQPVKALQRGFADLEELGLLERARRRKAGSMEWETTTYRPRLGTHRSNRPMGVSPKRGTHRSISTPGNRPSNYSLSNEAMSNGESIRPMGGESHRSNRPMGQETREPELAREEAGTPERSAPDVCPRHGTPLQIERLGGQEVRRCWACLDEEYGRAS